MSNHPPIVPVSVSSSNPRNLTSLSQILSLLSSLQSEEAQLSISLTELLNTKEPIVHSVTCLRSLSPAVEELHVESCTLSENVRNTALIAERVGGRVRLLDQEMGRVKEAMDRVGQVAELKASLTELRTAIDSQDWETAARHCSRVMSLPEEVISGSFAEIAVPTGDNPLPPFQVLHRFRETLLHIFQENFEKATKLRDSTATSRFFKLFPSIGFEEEGLEAYSAFVIELVRLQIPASSKSSSVFYYINTLVALFESIAKIVDHHQPIVEKYYGPGRMNKVVQRLVLECDKVVKGLLENWESDRCMKRKLSDIKENLPIPMFNPTGWRGATGSAEEDIVDPRDIDQVASELASMAGRWNLFRKFLADISKDEELEGQTNVKSLFPPIDLCALLDASTSGKMFEEFLDSYYTPFELWYVKTVINKAHRLSSPDLTQIPMVNTVPDDVFYIMKSVFSRVLCTGSTSTVKCTIEQLRLLIDNDYIGIIKKKMDEVYRNTPNGAAGRADKAERESKIVFITLLNDLEISSFHLDRLVKDLSESSAINLHFLDLDQPRIKEYISSIGVLGNRINAVLRAGLEHLFNQLVRPKLRNFVPELYKDVSYALDEEGYNVASHQDLVRRRFIKAWDHLMDGYKDMFSEGNYYLFLTLVLDTLVRPWEKFVFAFKFTELGAILFDHDLRSIVTFLSPQAVSGNVREKYAKLQQISMLLNLDNEDNINEFYNSSGISWKLTYQEAQTVIELKI